MSQSNRGQRGYRVPQRRTSSLVSAVKAERTRPAPEYTFVPYMSNMPIACSIACPGSDMRGPSDNSPTSGTTESNKVPAFHIGAGFV